MEPVLAEAVRCVSSEDSGHGVRLKLHLLEKSRKWLLPREPNWWFYGEPCTPYSGCRQSLKPLGRSKSSPNAVVFSISTEGATRLWFFRASWEVCFLQRWESSRLSRDDDVRRCVRSASALFLSSLVGCIWDAEETQNFQLVI